MAPHRVAVLALPQVVAFDLAMPGQLMRAPHYEVLVCAVAAGLVETSTGFAVHAAHGLEALRAADTVLVPGFDSTREPPPAAAVAALREADARGARMVSICTGAFALAAAGILDGRRATTHWDSAARLARMYPRVTVDPDVLFVDEGRVLTSAGVAAGIDLCLHLVRGDHGAAVAHAAARRTVVAPQRDGGQSQFIERAVAERGTGLARTRAWALERRAEPLSVAQLARHACCSERTFARRFREETGLPPLRWLVHQRVLEARRMLESGDAPIEVVAARCGFGTAAGLRLHFRRATGTTPTAYRAAWAGTQAA
jgi:transcriptional regulator GlxA family with amidase domain